MYKKSLPQKTSEKSKFNSEKPKFNKEKPKFNKEKPKFNKESSEFNKESSKFNKKARHSALDAESPKTKGLVSPSSISPRLRVKPAMTTARFDPRDNFHKEKKISPKTSQKAPVSEGIRLNKYIANAGICSRREADTLIESGVVRINGTICTQLGTRVMPDDKVEFGGETLISQKKVYLLMNKPKDYITTTDDPQERKTVMELIKGACKERIYPVGRLDRQTTGVLLFTNDGNMAKKLTHPSHGARKIYHVTLDKNVSKNDLQTIAKGVELEDGFVQIDELNLIAGTKNEVGIQLHSGMNRVVRRIFEKFDYKVVKLDRVLFAELTKKDLPRGRYRMLTDKEISFLKMK